MDNLTHSLVGASIAYVVAEPRKRVKNAAVPAFSALVLVSILANNFPDLDSLYASITPGPIGYLMHHRGHTHTLLGGALISAFLYFIFSFWIKPKPARRKLLLLCAIGPVVHVFMDSWNSYGVHPFWPVINRWFYGDAIFIVEPWLWTFLITGMLWQTESRTARTLLGMLFMGALGLCVFTDYVPWQAGIVYVVASLWIAGMQFKLPRGARVATALLLALSFVAGSFALSQSVKSRVRAHISQQFPGTRVLDVVASPMPANPLCWQVLSVETDDAGTHYFARKGVFAVAPRLLGSSECTTEEFSETPDQNPRTDFLNDVRAPKLPDLLWSGQFDAPISELQALEQSYCGISALLRFTRAPFWHRMTSDAPEPLLFADLRFTRRKKRTFSSATFGSAVNESTYYDRSCPANLPGWQPPRNDLRSLFID